jgi:hypothetical protein
LPTRVGSFVLRFGQLYDFIDALVLRKKLLDVVPRVHLDDRGRNFVPIAAEFTPTLNNDIKHFEGVLSQRDLQALNAWNTLTTSL